MTEREVFNKLRKDGINCIFTCRFLQNMNDSFEKSLRRFSREIEKDPMARRRPVMLLLGYLNFKITKYPDAIDWFNLVLKEDPNNLNALLSLVFIYDIMKINRNSEEQEIKIDDILVNESLVETSKACAKYELAAVLATVDAHLQTDGVSTAEKLFQQALECNEVPDIDRKEWEFGYAFFCFNVDTYNGHKSSEYFEKSMEYFYRIVKWNEPPVNENNWTRKHAERLNDVVAKAWCFMGSLVSKQGRFQKYKNLKDVLGHNCADDHSKFTLKDCMDQANARAKVSNEAFIYRRVGSSYLYMGNVNEAEEYVMKGVRLDKDNAYGHMLVGRFKLEQYKRFQNNFERIDILDEAIKNTSLAIEMGFTGWKCYLQLAKAQFLKREYIHAITNCNLSLCNGGKSKSQLFKLWADILEKMDDRKSAKEMREKARMVDEGKDNDEEMRCFGAIYNDDDVVKVASFVDVLEKNLHRRCYFPERDTTCGDDLVEAWGKIDKTCNIVLVFCGNEEFESCAKIALSSIITNRCKRREASSIVPVLLPGCKEAPDLLAANKPVVYDGSDGFVEELRKKLSLRRIALKET